MRKFIVLFLSFVLLSLAVSASVYAATPEEIKILPAGETVDRDYFSIGERSELNGTVNGDAYVAGGEVVVTGEVNGDLLTAGGNLIISGVVNGDVRIAGGNITFSGAEITGNVTAGGGNITFDSSTEVNGSIVVGAANLQVFSPIGKGATVGGGSVLLDSAFGGDVQVGATNLSVGPNAELAGGLTYYSENSANISGDAGIVGEVKQELPQQPQAEAPSGKEAGIAFAGLVYAFKILDTFWLIVIGLLFVYLVPKFTIKTAEFATKKIGWSLLAGFLVLIGLPVIGILLFVTVIGIPLALLLFIGYLFIFWIGRVFAAYAIGLFIVSKFTKKHHMAGAYILGIVVYLVLSVIPVFGFIVSLVVSLTGVGALVISKGHTYKELRSKNII